MLRKCAKIERTGGQGSLKIIIIIIIIIIVINYFKLVTLECFGKHSCTNYLIFFHTHKKSEVVRAGMIILKTQKGKLRS